MKDFALNEKLKFVQFVCRSYGKRQSKLRSFNSKITKILAFFLFAAVLWNLFKFIFSYI